MPLVFIIGFMGSGKTTFGKKLANRLKAEFIDLDALVLAEYNESSIKDLVAARGMDFFRQAESDTLKSITSTNAVVSTGGGTPCYFDNIDWMKRRGAVVFLQVDEGVIYSRLKTTGLEERPLLNGLDDAGLKEFIHNTLQQRLPYYRQADITFNPVTEKTDALVLKLTK